MIEHGTEQEICGKNLIKLKDDREGKRLAWAKKQCTHMHIAHYAEAPGGGEIGCDAHGLLYTPECRFNPNAPCKLRERPKQ